MAEQEVDLGYTLYDANKQLVSQMTPLSKEELKNEVTNIGCWFSVANQYKYFMLLCHERRDYTVFNFLTVNYSKAAEELLEVLEERGTTMSIHFVQEQNAYEIWVKVESDEIIPESFGTNVVVYYLFPCDPMILEI